MICFLCNHTTAHSNSTAFFLMRHYFVRSLKVGAVHSCVRTHSSHNSTYACSRHRASVSLALLDPVILPVWSNAPP